MHPSFGGRLRSGRYNPLLADRDAFPSEPSRRTTRWPVRANSSGENGNKRREQVAGYNLQPGECFVHKQGRVLYGKTYLDELILTSQNLVLLKTVKSRGW